MSADDCIKCFVKNVPDSRRKYPILSRLIAGCKDNNVELRRFAIQYLTIVVDQYISEYGSFPKTIWGRLENLIKSPKSGIHDADQRVRFSSYGLLYRGELSSLPEAVSIASKLIGVPKKTYKEQKDKLTRSGSLPAQLSEGQVHVSGLNEEKRSSAIMSSSRIASSSESEVPPSYKKSRSLPTIEKNVPKAIKKRPLPSTDKAGINYAYKLSSTPFVIPDAFTFDIFSQPYSERKTVEHEQRPAVHSTPNVQMRSRSSYEESPTKLKKSKSVTPKAAKLVKQNNRGVARTRKTGKTIDASDLKPKALRFRNGSSLPKKSDRIPRTRKMPQTSTSPKIERKQKIKLNLDSSARVKISSDPVNPKNHFEGLVIGPFSPSRGRNSARSVGSKPNASRGRPLSTKTIIKRSPSKKNITSSPKVSKSLLIIP
jgi:hypothetical protein